MAAAEGLGSLRFRSLRAKNFGRLDSALGFMLACVFSCFVAADECGVRLLKRVCECSSFKGRQGEGTISKYPSCTLQETMGFGTKMVSAIHVASSLAMTMRNRHPQYRHA